MEARADELHPERQSLRPGAGRQGAARRPGQGPDRIEARIAGRTRPLGRFAGGARDQQQIDIGKDVADMTAERRLRLGRAVVPVDGARSIFRFRVPTTAL
jgi:hypothetical protein